MIRNDNYRELDDLLDEDALRSSPEDEYGYVENDELENAKELIMTPEQMAEQRREGCLNSICELLEGWIRYYEKLDSTVSENGMSSATP